ncbi:MAG: hypothetical protein AAGH76_08855 [Pseudomonadota bacterium]
MRSLFAAVSLFLQVVGLFGLAIAMLGVLKFVQITALYGSPDDPRLVAGGLAQILTGLLVPGMCGFVGVLIAWLLLRKGTESPGWFKQILRVLAWVWIVLVPVGTAVGLLLLVWLRRSTAAESTGDVD